MKRLTVFLILPLILSGDGYNLQRANCRRSLGFIEKDQVMLRSKVDDLPLQHTQTCFCTFSEEFGFLGAFIVLHFFCIDDFCNHSVWAMKTENTFSKLVLVNSSRVVVPVLQNVGMCIGIMPITGIPLLFYQLWINIDDVYHFL